MKKLLIFFSFFIFHSSFSQSLDTVVYDDGVKITGHIISVGDQIKFTDAKGKKYHPDKAVVSYIHYATGELVKLNPPLVKS